MTKRPASRADLLMVRDLERRLHGNSTLDVIGRTADALLPEVPADIWCGVSLDPSTLLNTGGEHRFGFPEHVMPRLLQLEHAEQDDLGHLRAPPRGPELTSLLSVATGGRLDTSTYYREILRPLGLADELRLALRDGGRTWGLLVLCRGSGSAPFTDRDVAAAEAFSTPAATAMRRSLLQPGTDTGSICAAPGLLMLDHRYEVRWSTPTTQQWLDEFPERRRPSGAHVPYAVCAAAARARGPAGGPVSSRVRTKSGHWAALTAWPVDQDGESGTAISIGPAGPAELAALVLDALGMTAREQDVVRQVLRGLPTREIARSLGMSAHTVQDHLKSIFAKAGVRSRGELLSKIFLDHCRPPPG